MNEYEPDYVRQLQSEIAALKAELENQVDPLCYTQHELIEVQFRRPRSVRRQLHRDGGFPWDFQDVR